jgi:hypothetical protein
LHVTVIAWVSRDQRDNPDVGGGDTARKPPGLT